ncbi:MAG: hypothetical protein HGA31_04950 [Candidatus Moranbacteria bacterium]|nr:hypothetical protein [Candidatus Moranbacteria bacterium]
MSTNFLLIAPIVFIVFGLSMTAWLSFKWKATKRWVIILLGPLATFLILFGLLAGVVPDGDTTVFHGLIILGCLVGLFLYYPIVFVFALVHHLKKKSLTRRPE